MIQSSNLLEGRNILSSFEVLSSNGLLSSVLQILMGWRGGGGGGGNKHNNIHRNVQTLQANRQRVGQDKIKKSLLDKYLPKPNIYLNVRKKIGVGGRGDLIVFIKVLFFLSCDIVSIIHYLMKMSLFCYACSSYYCCTVLIHIPVNYCVYIYSCLLPFPRHIG